MASEIAFDKALGLTVEWYKAYSDGNNMHEFSLGQIGAYRIAGERWHSSHESDMPRRVLFTVGTFIGARIAERLYERGHALALLLRSPNAEIAPPQIHGNADKRRRSTFAVSYSDALRAFRPDALVHAAWTASPEANAMTPPDREHCCHGGSSRKAIAAGIQIFVGFGSQAEYGAQNCKLDERAPVEPTTLYGIVSSPRAVSPNPYAD